MLCSRQFPGNQGNSPCAASSGEGETAAAGVSRGQQGFTLMELVLVMALLALIMGLVLPTMQGTITRERQRANLRQFTTVLRLARSTAATNRQRVRVFVDRESGRYRLEGSNRQGVLTGMRLEEIHLVWQEADKRHGYIAFYGDGSSSGGKLVLDDPAGRRYHLKVEIITGKVSLTTGEEKT